MTERNKTADTHVAVVADQTDDGAFELRVERTESEANAVVSESAARASGALHASRSKTRSRWIGVAAGGVAGAVLVGLVLSVGVRNPGPPPIPEPEPAPAFRAFAIQPNLQPQTISASALAFDIGILLEEDAGTEQEEGQEAEQEQAPDEGSSVLPVIPGSVLEPPAINSDSMRRLENVRVSPNAMVVPAIALDDEAASGDEAGESDEYEDEEYLDEYDEYDDEPYDEYEEE